MQTAKLTVVAFDAQDVIATSGGIKGYYAKGTTLDYNMYAPNVNGKFYTAQFRGYGDDERNYLVTSLFYRDGDPGDAFFYVDLFEGDTTGYAEITEDRSTVEEAFVWLIENGKGSAY